MTLHVATSPITNTIFAGSVNKDGVTWGGNKTDVTGEACAAVAQHALAKGGTITVTANGKPRWEIAVRELGHNSLVVRREPQASVRTNEELDGNRN